MAGLLALTLMAFPSFCSADTAIKAKPADVVAKLQGKRIMSIQDVDEPVTVVKFDVFRKKVSIYTGQVLDGNALYVDFPNCICRNKMLVQIDRPEQCYLLPSDPKQGAFRSWWGSWGCHQVAIYGDLREALKEFATLTGFQAVEGKE
jgi:hypothetical protein